METVLEFYSKVGREDVLVLSCSRDGASPSPRSLHTDEWCMLCPLCSLSSLLPPLLQLPKGPAPKANKGLNPFARYKAAYFAPGKESGAPILHAIGAIFLIGYTIDVSVWIVEREGCVCVCFGARKS